MNASARVSLGEIVVRKRPDSPVIQQNRRLRILGSAIESSERPMAVVGQRLSRKFRLNGLISRQIRPNVYAEHNPIAVPALESTHANCGLRTLSCDYVGGVRFIMPAAGNDFFKTHRYFARAVNAPLRVVNQTDQVLSRFTGYTTRSIWLSDLVRHIGEKADGRD